MKQKLRGFVDQHLENKLIGNRITLYGYILRMNKSSVI